MKRKIITVGIAVFFFLLAIAIMLYPMISNAYNAKHHSELLTDYSIEVSQADNRELIQAKEKAAAYNQTLSANLQMVDPFGEEALQAALDDYSNLLNLNGSGIMGYIDIPAIDVHLQFWQLL